MNWGDFQRQGQLKAQAPSRVSANQHLSFNYSFEHLATPKPEFVLASKAQP